LKLILPVDISTVTLENHNAVEVRLCDCAERFGR